MSIEDVVATKLDVVVMAPILRMRRYEILDEQKVPSQLAVDTHMQRSAINKLHSLPVRASFVEPMECLTVARLPEGSQWLWEIKLDGYRALAVKSGSAVTLFSRRGKPLNRQFPHIVERLADLPDGTVVDGELVAIDDSGRPDFHLLQNFRAAASRIHYYIFDLLCCKDRDLTHLPLTDAVSDYDSARY